MFNLNAQQNQFYQPINMNNMNSNVNMNQAMNNMNQFTGWNFNNMAQFVQMVNSNPMFLMMYYQMLANMGNNPFANMNVNNTQGNGYRININFLTADGKKVIIQTEPNEKMSSVINKYINKSGDLNAGNYYIFNNKKIVQQLSVAELGINDGAEVIVANTGNVIGAFLV